MASAPDRFKRVSVLSEPSWLGRPCRLSHQDRSSSASWGNPQRALGSCCNAVQKPSSSLHHIDSDHGHTGRLRSYGSAEAATLQADLKGCEGLLLKLPPAQLLYSLGVWELFILGGSMIDQQGADTVLPHWQVSLRSFLCRSQGAGSAAHTGNSRHPRTQDQSHICTPSKVLHSRSFPRAEAGHLSSWRMSPRLSGSPVRAEQPDRSSS